MKRVVPLGVIACLAAVAQTFLPAGQPPVKPAEVVDLTVPVGPAPKGIAEVVESEPDAHDAAQPGLPRAEIAADGEVHLGCWLLLDGSRSRSPDDKPLAFEWRQIAGPGISRRGAETQRWDENKLWLFLSTPGAFRFVLRVKNDVGWSSPREVKFTVKPGRPFLSDAEGCRFTGAGERVDLPGEGWKQSQGPSIELRYEDGVSFFRPARPGLYIFEAPRAGDVPERRGIIVPPGRDPALGDRRPTARLPKSLAGFVNRPVLISGALSRDPDGADETAALIARWETPDKQRGVELTPLPGLRARFKVARAGVYSVSLIVSDGRLDSQPPETVFVRVEELPAGGVDALPDALGWDDEIETARDDVRGRKISLGLWGNLDRAVQMFPSRCGVALRVDPDVAPPDRLAELPLALEVMDGALVHLVDWLARQTGSRYRREGGRSFWLTKPDAWAKEEKLEAAVVQVDALFTAPDGSDLMTSLTPCFQRILDARPGTSMIFERGRQEIQCVLPASACVRLKEIAATLRVPEGQGLPPPDPLSPAEFRLQRLLGDKTITLKRERCRLIEVLRDFSQAAGIPMGFDPRQFPKGVPHITVNIEDAPVRDAARTIVDLAGFDGCSVEAPGGLWFYRGARPFPSGELLWDQTVVQAYDLAALLPRIAPISGELIAFAVQKRIYPDSWKEPGAGVLYHAPTKRLVVLHGPDAQRKVLEFLNDLAQRGEWALGPAE